MNQKFDISLSVTLKDGKTWKDLQAEIAGLKLTSADVKYHFIINELSPPDDETKTV